MRVGVAPEETAVLVGWRKRPGSRVLAGMKAEAVLHASRGVDAGIIAETVERTERTVQERLAEWRGTRMCWVPAGHAGNQGDGAGGGPLADGPGRACGEPGRGGTRPHPEGRPQGHPRPAALPDGRPRRVPGRPGPA